MGSVVTGLRTVVPPAAQAFRRRFPTVELAVAEGQPTDLMARLRLRLPTTTSPMWS